MLSYVWAFLINYSLAVSLVDLLRPLRLVPLLIRGKSVLSRLSLSLSSSLSLSGSLSSSLFFLLSLYPSLSFFFFFFFSSLSLILLFLLSLFLSLFLLSLFLLLFLLLLLLLLFLSLSPSICLPAGLSIPPALWWNMYNCIFWYLCRKKATGDSYRATIPLMIGEECVKQGNVKGNWTFLRYVMNLVTDLFGFVKALLPKCIRW